MIPNTTIYIKHSHTEPDCYTIEAYTPSRDAWFDTAYEYDLADKLKQLGQSLIYAKEKENVLTK